MTELSIGILTFHRCINYGSYWQALCLTTGLSRPGNKVFLLDHCSSVINFAEWKCALQPVLPAIVPKGDVPLYRKKTEKFFTSFDQLPLSPKFDLDDPEDAPELDLLVVGSDEVWNLHHPWYGRKKIFFGEGITALRTIAYGASFGNYPGDLPLEKEYASLIVKNFSRISVRDQYAASLVSNATGMNPEIVLDPCLQFPLVLKKPSGDFPQKPYIAVYGHNFSPDFISAIRSSAAEQGLPLISIGYRNDWADLQWLDAGPDDFALFMSKAEGVVTNFFHGCVFSLKFNRPFVAEASAYRSNKIKGLLELLGAKHHLVHPDTPQGVINILLTSPLHPAIQETIQHYRNLSWNYIDAAMTELTIKNNE